MSGNSNPEMTKKPDNGHFGPVNFTMSGGQGDDHAEEKASSSRIASVLDVIIAISLFLLFLGTPLFFTGFSLQGIVFEKQMYFYFLILLVLVSWVSKGIIVGEMKIVRTPLDIPLLLFWAISGIGIFFSVDRWHSFWGSFGDPSRGFMGLTALIVAYYLVVSHFSQRKFLIFITGLLISDFVLVVWSILYFMGAKVVLEKLGMYIPLSPIGSLTGLGIFLGTVLPLFAMLCFHLFSEKCLIAGRKKKIGLFVILFAGMLMNIFALLVLYSYVFWIAVLAGISFFLIYILAQIMRPNGNLTWIPMFLFVSVLAILMVGNNPISRIKLPVEARPSYELSWNIAKDALKDSFLIGSGPSTYGYAFSLYRPQDFNSNAFYGIRFSQGSGIFFETLSTMGILGTFFLVLLVLTFLSIGIYLLSISKNRNKLYSLGAFSSALIALISILATKVEGSLLIIGFLLIALSVAMLLYESNTEKNFLTLSFKASPKYALSFAFIFMVVSTGVLFLFFFLGKIYFADIQAGLALRENAGERSIVKIEKAIYLNDKESRYLTLLGQQFMFLANNEAKKGEDERNMEIIQNNINNSITFANIAKNMSGKDIAAVEALAQIYENSGFFVLDSFKFAEENYRRALELEPHNPLYSVKLGQIKLAQASSEKNAEEAKARIGEAADLFQKAIEEKGNLAVAHYELALSKEALGNLDDAVRSIEQAVLFEKENSNYIFNAARIHQARGNDEDLKISEAIYKNLLQRNDKDANVRFSLGLLYEKTKRNNLASDEYGKVLSTLSDDNKEVKARIEKMISNIANGIENKPENLAIEKIGNSGDEISQ